LQHIDHSLKIVILSDIHSNLNALEAVVDKFPKYDELVCLGDVVGYGPQPNEVIAKLQRLRPTIVLMGNHDCAVVTGDVEGFSSHASAAVEWTRREISGVSLHYLAALKPSARLEREGVTLALFHGSPRDPLSEYVFPGLPERAYRSLVETAAANIVLLGHTHMPMLYRINGGVLANPGSVGQPRDGDYRASFALLTISQGEVSFEVQRVEYDVSSVADRIIGSGLPSFLAERLYIGV
jgi:putative phosphoesterase